MRAFPLRFVRSITPFHMSLNVMSTAISKVTIPNASAHQEGRKFNERKVIFKGYDFDSDNRLLVVLRISVD